MSKWEEIEKKSKTLSPWMADESTALADLRRLNEYGLPVCEVAEIDGTDQWAGRYMFADWEAFESKEGAMSAMDEVAVCCGCIL